MRDSYEEELYDAIRSAQKSGVPMSDFLEALEEHWKIVAKEILDADLEELNSRGGKQ
jgi:hypothetical protein